MIGERSMPISDAAVLAVAGLAAALAGTVWLWGGLAGLVFGHGWPRIAAGQLPAVIARLPARLGHPAAAWPAATRPLLPARPGSTPRSACWRCAPSP